MNTSGIARLRRVVAAAMAAVCLSLTPTPCGAADGQGEVSGRRPDGPVFPSPAGMDAVEELRNRVAPVLKLSETEMVALIPDRSGIYFVGFPNCSGGTQEGQISWTIERPDEVFCKFCGMRFPNEKFPENRVLRVQNPLGAVQEYPCYEAPVPLSRGRPASVPQTEAGEGYRYFFREKGWYLARAYFEEAARNLAVLYRLTGDRVYARRAALILNRFAEVYPGYCVHRINPRGCRLL
ncbi:MAG: hypothetical protein EXS64_09090 [Candidatus Latescibacteria bacterium]|nr:hypothetical protein [Candidatus Latescibacterota bacterium]